MYLTDDLMKKKPLTAPFMPWLICLAATALFFYEFIQGNMFASMAANIMQDYQIKVDKMAYLSSAYYLANVLFLFVAGILLDRYSIRTILLIAMVSSVFSTFLLASSNSFYMALFSRFIMGIGSAFCFLGPVRLAAHWFPPKRMALVTGVIITLAMTGGMIAQYPMMKLITYVGWREAVWYLGVLGLLLFFFMFLGIKEKKSDLICDEKAMPMWLAAKSAYTNTQYLRAALFTSLMNMAIAVFGAMMGTLYLEQRLKVDSEQASLVNGLLFLGAIIGGPLLGWISDKVGLRVLPMKIGALSSLLILLGILYLPVNMALMSLLFFLLGLFTSAQVISYALVAESSISTMTATAVSVVSIVTQGGFLIYQNVFSLLLSHYGSLQVSGDLAVYDLEAYQHAALILPLGLLVALWMLRGLKETHCRSTF